MTPPGAPRVVNPMSWGLLHDDDELACGTAVLDDREVGARVDPPPGWKTSPSSSRHTPRTRGDRVDRATVLTYPRIGVTRSATAGIMARRP